MSKKWVHPGAMIALVLKALFQKPATVDYPVKPLPAPARFRGEIRFDPVKCIGCQLCVKDCPSNAIKIIKVGEKQFELAIDLGKCIYCGQCADSCMKKAIELTPIYELAQTERAKLKIVFNVESEIKPAADTDS
jgi:formate hydrogenlyase subunit 6/NADH:ubiquinone oxidoreductase subunit I